MRRSCTMVCLCMMMVMFSSIALAQSVSTHPQTPIQNATDQTLTASQDNQSPDAQDTITPQDVSRRLDAMLTAPDYSDAKEEKRWQAKNPKPEPEVPDIDVDWLVSLVDFFRTIGKNIGVVAKILAVGFLLAMAWLAYRTRKIWLRWFSNVMLRSTSTQAVVKQTVIAPDIPLWAHLPKKDKFTAHLHVLLAQGQWLQVLSLLYQGTLREISQRHTLPINQGDTEDSCVWLLAHAKSANPKEQAYFGELVSLWRASAYGQKIPEGIATSDYSGIRRLIQIWGEIYG